MSDILEGVSLECLKKMVALAKKGQGGRNSQGDIVK